MTGITLRALTVGRVGATTMSLNRLLTRFLFAGVVVVPAAGAAAATRTIRDDISQPDDDLDDDGVDDDGVDAAIEHMVVTTRPVVAAQKLRALLEYMDPFDATRVATTAALSPSVDVRRALADALMWPFRLVGETFVLEQLMQDADYDVRIAARAAARVRYST